MPTVRSGGNIAHLNDRFSGIVSGVAIVCIVVSAIAIVRTIVGSSIGAVRVDAWVIIRATTIASLISISLGITESIFIELAISDKWV